MLILEWHALLYKGILSLYYRYIELLQTDKQNIHKVESIPGVDIWLPKVVFKL